MSSEQAKGIGSFGSIALLVSSMTGPGLSTIPPLFQQTGWVAPMFVFLAVAILSSFAAFFVIEVLSSIRGNERFQAKVEFTTVAQLMLGKKYHYFFQIVLFLALQAVNIASIVLSAQTMDSMLLTLFNGTCGLGISPGRWYCITEHTTLGNSPFSSDDYYIFTFGYLISALMVVPLGFFSLVENIFVQMTSFIVLCAILIQWIVAFCQEGLDTSRLPASGPNSALVLGIVIFNYSYITTIPTWVNDLKPQVNIHRCLSISVVISTIMYIMLGVFGAMAYQMSASSDILAILSTKGSTASLVTTYLFPICALVTSIPVFTIVIRQNLVRGQICGNNLAVFLSNILPWLVCIPLQTKDYVGTIQNWSSLFFQSTVNFILPFILYFASRKYKASVVEEITEKNPQEPDDVSMYFPEENKSISLRRTSNLYQSRLSRMEQSGITKSYPGSPLSFGRSPRSPRSPRSDNPPPAIVLRQDTQANIETLQVPAASPQGSPNILRVPDSPRPRTSNESRPTTTTLASAQGLGITPKVEESPSSPPQADISPRIVKSPQSNRIASNLICSNLSLRNNSAVAPSGIIVTDSDIKNEQAIIQEEHVEEQPHFMAFKPRPWLNPFYVAVVSSILLSVSVVFMIIYDLTMLGLGRDVLSE